MASYKSVFFHPPSIFYSTSAHLFFILMSKNIYDITLMRKLWGKTTKAWDYINVLRKYDVSLLTWLGSLLFLN